MSVRSLPLFVGSRYAAFGASRVLTGFISRLAVIGLAIGVAILITALSIINGFDRELREKVLALLPHVTVTTLDGYPLDSRENWQAVMDQVNSVPGVSGSAPLVSLQGMVIANGGSKGVALSGIDPGAEQHISILDQFIQGAGLASLEPGEFRILVGSGLAQSLGLQVGDSLMLISTEIPVTLLGARPARKRFTVAGIFTIGSELDNALVYVNLDDAVRLYRLGTGIHGIRIQLDDLFEAGSLASSLRPLLPDDAATSDWSYQFGAVYENIRLSKTMVGLLLFMLVVVAAFNVVVSLAMIVRDKQGDIAILRTMGVSEQQIRQIFIVQGGMIGVSGSLAGLLVGAGLALVLTDAAAWFERVSGYSLFSSGVYPVNYLPTSVSAGDCVLVVSSAIVLCLLAAVFPAISAARVRPAEALRFE